MQRNIAAIAVMLMSVAGCQWIHRDRDVDYRTVADDPRRDTQAARRHNARAVGLLKEGHLDQAEAELKAALKADLFFGPAHNNLGNVYYRQEKFYLAAWEFQYAAKLMPNRAAPRNNLGLVFEAVGRLDDAAKWYEEALQLEDGSVEIMGNLARVLVRTNRKDERTRKLLTDLVMKDRRPKWVAWARQQLALLGAPPVPASQPAEE